MKPDRYLFIYTFTYMAIGAFCPLIGKYLESEGFSGSEIGIVTAAGTLMAIFASMFWGRVYVASTRRKNVPALLSICASVLCLILMRTVSFVPCLFIYMLMYFFQAPILALVDAMCVEERKAFGMSRMWGAVGYALGVLIAGRAAAHMSLSVIFVIYAASYVLSAVFIMAGKKTEHASRTRRGRKRGYRELLEDRRLVKLLVAVFFFGGTNVANNTYFSFMYTDCGGTLAGVGVAMFLMIVAEAPFMAASEPLSARFGMERMIVIAMAVSALRFAIYGAGVSPVVITSIFFLQGFVNGIALVEIIRYIAKITDPEMTALATSAYYAISSNLSTIVCQLAGGVILEHFGGCGVYVFFALYNLTGVIIYLVFGLQKATENPYEII